MDSEMMKIKKGRQSEIRGSGMTQKSYEGEEETMMRKRTIKIM